jgi:hypothetical protein
MFPSDLLTAHEPRSAERAVLCTPPAKLSARKTGLDAESSRSVVECGSPLPLMPQTVEPRESQEIRHNFAASQCVSEYTIPLATELRPFISLILFIL